MIYRQTRVGRWGRPFTILKFRTIRDGAVVRPFLRHTGLDELPQIVNIMRGEMAIFGPRPEQPVQDIVYGALVPRWVERYAHKPGLLSLASVEGTIRGEHRFTLAAKVVQARLDVEMMENMGIWMRLRILVRLPLTIIRGQTGV